MKLKYDYELMDLGDQLVVVVVGEGADQFHNVIKTNESGAAIFNLLREETTEQAIVAALTQEYGTQENIASFVHDFLYKLKEAGMLA